MPFSVYKCVNIINNKIYIGCTTRLLKKRLKEHIRNANYGKERYFYYAIRKYGSDNFIIELIEEYNNFKDMLEGEAKWISYYNSTDPMIGYNSTSGGRQAKMSDRIKKKISETMKKVAPFKGRHHTEESKQLLREQRLGQKISEEHKRKIGNSQRGEKHWTYGIARSQETIEKIRAGNLGKKMSEGSRNKMSISRLGKPHNNKKKGSVSIYYGVTIKRGNGKPWMARVTLPDGKRQYIGIFDTEIEAAIAYDEFVMKNKLSSPLNFEATK